MSFPVVKLGEVCSFVRGLTYSKSDEVEFSSNVVIRATNIDLETHKLDFNELRYISDSIQIKDDKKLKKDDILICTASGSKSHLGKVAIVESELGMAFGGFMGALRVNPIKIMPQYLFTFLVSSEFKRHIESLSDGANINNLKFSQIENLELPLPPLKTQQQMVAKLDAIFAEINKATAAAEANAKNAEVIFYSILNKLLDENKTGWSSLYLKDACEFINRGISPSYLENDNEGILILNQKCVRNHKISFELGRRHDVIKKQVKEERLIRYGDVLVNSTGTGTLGRVAQVVDEILEPTTVDSHVTIVRPNLNKFSASFFGFMMIQIEDDIKKAGEGSVGQTELSRTTLSEKFKVVFPNDKKLQDSLYLQLTTAKENSIKVKRLMELKLKELIFLKQSILKQAFNGELIKE